MWEPVPLPRPLATTSTVVPRLLLSERKLGERFPAFGTMPQSPRASLPAWFNRGPTCRVLFVNRNMSSTPRIVQADGD